MYTYKISIYMCVYTRTYIHKIPLSFNKTMYREKPERERVYNLTIIRRE